MEKCTKTEHQTRYLRVANLPDDLPKDRSNCEKESVIMLDKLCHTAD